MTSKMQDDCFQIAGKIKLYVFLTKAIIDGR